MNMNGVQRFLSRREKKAKPNGEVVSTLKHFVPHVGLLSYFSTIHDIVTVGC